LCYEQRKKQILPATIKSIFYNNMRHFCNSSAKFRIDEQTLVDFTWYSSFNILKTV